MFLSKFVSITNKLKSLKHSHQGDDFLEIYVYCIVMICIEQQGSLIIRRDSAVLIKGAISTFPSSFKCIIKITFKTSTPIHHLMNPQKFLVCLTSDRWICLDKCQIRMSKNISTVHFAFWINNFINQGQTTYNGRSFKCICFN